MVEELQLDLTEADISVELKTVRAHEKDTRYPVASLCIDTPTLSIRLTGEIGCPDRLAFTLKDLGADLLKRINKLEAQ